MIEETTNPETPPAKAPAAKKPKEPALEDKPLAEFIEQNFIPALKNTLSKSGTEAEIAFSEAPINVIGLSGSPCWQLTGSLENGSRQFTVYFLEGDINGKKAFSYADKGSKPSTIESFMIDERKVNLDLLLLYTLQRLNGQKWLARN